MTTEIFYGPHLLTFQVSSCLPATTCCCQHQYLVAPCFYIFKFCFPGPVLLVFLLDRIGRKKSFALCFLMFSLFMLPMYACLGRYVSALCFRTSLQSQKADAGLCFLGVPQHTCHEPDPRHQSLYCYINPSLLRLRTRGSAGDLTLKHVLCAAELINMLSALTHQVFPTQTRALGFGFCAGIGKIGSLISPFVSEVSKYPSILVETTCRRRL